MKTRQVLRFEHRGSGEGMFSSGAAYNIGYIGDRHREFNTPYRDGLDLERDGKEWFCGYKTIEQMQEWVKKEEAQKLIARYHDALLLEVSEWQEGSHQIIFTRESIQSRKVINELFD